MDLPRRLFGALCALAFSACVDPVAWSQTSTPAATRPESSSPAAPMPAPIPQSSATTNRAAANRSRVPAIAPVRATVYVDAQVEESATGEPAPYKVTRSAVLESAGTWGDFTRYLQLLPGVVWNTDLTNEAMVRGGNPTENLYVVDGIEVPNINHIALEGTTGGFASMIDTSAIARVDLKPGPYDPQYAGRLSSLIEIHTRGGDAAEPVRELDVGISGAGGLFEQPLGRQGEVLLTAHRSVLNLATNDIGINGVPVYVNGLGQMQWSPNIRNRIAAVSVTGDDTLDMTPQPCDGGVTLNVQTQYAGARSTEGAVWTHLYSARAFATLVVSRSDQGQNIGQQLQTAGDAGGAACWNSPIETTPVYSENSHDGITTVSYGMHLALGHVLLAAGGRGQAVTTNDAVDQPLGQQSPLNPSPAWTDADQFARALTTGVTGTYGEITAHVKTLWTLMGGAREETFSMTGSHAFEPSASLALRIGGHENVNVNWGRTAQLPPAIDILSYAGNGRLRPVRVEEYSVGSDLWHGSWATLHAETYRKRYSDEPVSTEYPSLMLANMVDMLGQFVWLPLRTGGFGETGGVEMLLRAHAGDRLELMGSTSYSRTRYAAGDGILRPGNFDFPLVGNGIVTARIGGGLQISIRDTYEEGRPYTPFNIPLSEAQSRGIYDLSRINALRGPAYNRADADLNRDFHIRRTVLNVRGGVENAFDRANFLGYAWMPNCHPRPSQTMCGENPNALPGVPETEVYQMPLFPSVMVRYTF